MSDLYLREVAVSIVPTTGAPKRIQGLRVRFKGKKNEESKPNTMGLEIFNLSENTRSQLEGKNTSIILEAGYAGRTEVISKAELADGGHRYRNSRINKGIPPGAKTKQVIDELVKSIGLTQGAIIGVPSTQYPNGITLHGMSRDRLDEVCKKNGLQWSIQDGVLQIVPEKKTTFDSVLVISPDSGLIGSPNKTKRGVEFKTLLMPLLKPGRRVKLESRFIKGIFKISVVSHSGDSMQGEFYSEVEAGGGSLIG